MSGVLSRDNIIVQVDKKTGGDEDRYVDEVDKPPAGYRVDYWDIAGLYISIICHLADIILDINVAYQYLSHNQLLYFILTIGFIYVPAFIYTAFSFKMDIKDGKFNFNSRKITKQFILLLLILLFQFAPILRYLKSLKYAKLSQKAEKDKDSTKQMHYYELMVKEDSDVSLLKIFECFLEAAPQQILQITILLVTYGRGLSTFSIIHNFGSIASSFASMAWSIASYHRNVRFARKSKENIDLIGTFMQFMWHILVTVSRILSICVLASVDPSSLCIGLFIHWLLMSIWLSCTEKTNFCDYNKCFDTIFYAIFGLVYIFTYISLSDGPTKSKYAFYYTICFFENMTAAFVWYFTANNDSSNAVSLKLYEEWNQPLIVLTTIPFILGILFMISYYLCFHPTVKYQDALDTKAVMSKTNSNNISKNTSKFNKKIIISANTI